MESMEKQATEPVDFVLLWVDGSDPEWLASKRHWQRENGCPEGLADPEKDEQNGFRRYRDNGLLRHWFRAVERFAPWVRRVFFVTCGQKPEWLDESHPKLRLVSHADFMPEAFLPTFNGDPIQLCLHRIPELAEHFVLFDDDTFLLRPVRPTFYFRGGNPVLEASLRPIQGVGDRPWLRLVYNNSYEVNSHFDISRAVWANRRKWFDVRALGLPRAAANFLCWRLNGWLPAKSYGHLPLPHLKSTFAEIERRCPETFERTCRSRFRSHDHVSHWLAAAWNLASGRFSPARRPPVEAEMTVSRTNVGFACAAIRGQAFPQICLNDPAGTDDSIHCFGLLRQAFGELLPDRSSFEKD